jgi:hypothetical protein
VSDVKEALFDDPGGNQVEWSDHLGKLLLIWPLSQETVKTNDYGEKEAIRADMVVLDGADGPEDMPDVLVFPLVMQGQLRRNLSNGKPIVGRLGQGEAKKDSKGRETQKPPWKLLEASEGDKVTATKYLTNRQAKPKPEQKFDDVPF